MEYKDSVSQDHFMDEYDEDHTNDIESRLYAEIYYSNSIIGDENNTPNSAANRPSDVVHSTERTIMDIQVPERNVQSAQTKNSVTNTLTTESLLSSVDHNVDNSRIRVEGNLGSLHVPNNTNNSEILNRTPRCNKRSSAIVSINDELSETNKRKKHSDINDSTERQSALNFFPNDENISEANHKINKSTDLQHSENQIFNPYNKHLTNNSQKGYKLLSPEFINLLFGKSKNKKDDVPNKNKDRFKLNKFILKNKTSQKLNKTNAKQNNKRENILKNQHIIEKSNSEDKNIRNVQTTEFETEQNRRIEQINENQGVQNDLPEATIIDVSSESSKDTVDDNSKYNMVSVATDEKLAEKQSSFNNTNVDDSASDTESIFEVPIPPKPTPPLIELKDSDESNDESDDESDDESNAESKNDSDSSSSDSFISPASVPQNKEKTTLNSVIPSTEVILEISSDSDESDSLILNCTEIQKGTSSLNEIKKTSRETNTVESPTKEKNTSMQNLIVEREKENSYDINICNIETLQDEPNSSRTTIKSNLKKSASNRQNIPEEEYFFQPMTDKMKSFYNESWGGENFDLDQLKSKMSSDPKRWGILGEDLMQCYSRRNNKRYFGMVCSRCHKDGHKQNQCPEPYKGPICNMCGTIGHLVNSCPHKKCLTCGRKQTMYRQICEHCEKMICSRCNSRGHMEYSCPDLWRRYHQTININDAKTPKNVKTVMKPSHQLFCCNCAKRGHESADCRKYRWSQHFPNPSYVTNYSGPDYFDENYDVSSSMNDSYSSYNLSMTYDSSFNFNSTHDNSTSFNITLEKTHNLNTSRANNESEYQRFPPKNVIESNNKVIFNITSKVVDENIRKLKNTVLKLNVPDINDSSKCESWKILSRFLNQVASQLHVNFLLEHKKKCIQMTVNCSQKYIVLLSKIIRQYACRNNFERSYMYLDWIRDSKHISNHLTRKLNEIKTVTEDPIQLYEEIRQLSTEIASKKQTVNDLRCSSKGSKLMICQQKLLMALYREGVADDSLQKLQKLRKKVKTSTFISKNAASEKQSKSKAPIQLITIKWLLQYLHYYNNVFVPYEPKNLSLFVKKYNENLERRNRLQKNPLLFPPKQNIPVACNEPNSTTVMQNNNLTTAVAPENNVTSSTLSSHISPLLPANTVIISQIPSLLSVNPSETSQIPPLLSVNTSITSNFHISQEQIKNANSIVQNDSFSSSTISNNMGVQESVKIRKKTNQKKDKLSPNSLYVAAKYAKGKRKTILEERFHKFIGKTKKLLVKANKLNAPHLQHDINILEDKMKNEIYVFKKDVKPLQKLVNLELNRRKSER